MLFRSQIEKSFAIFKQPKIDLIQVHNMGDPATQLPIVREFKKAGRVRYVGITTTFPNQYAQLIEVMRNEPLDFIGVDYAADNRDVEDVILPLAIEKKIAVLAYAPFGRTSLFRRAAGRELPAFAKPGQRIDVTVSALGKASNLRGGTLLLTSLRGVDGETYALAQGPLSATPGQGYWLEVDVVQVLEVEGVDKFVASWEELLATVSAALDAARPAKG